MPVVDWEKRCKELKKQNDELRKEADKWQRNYNDLYNQWTSEHAEHFKALRKSIIEALEWSPPYRQY